MSDLSVLSVVCPMCDGRKARMVEPGDKYDPPQFEDCPEVGGCGGLGVVPSDALLAASSDGDYWTNSRMIAFAVLRLIEEA